MTALDSTHDPDRRSWVESANTPGIDFPIQNLPYGVFRRRGTDDAFRVGVAIGDLILDLAAVHQQGGFSGEAARAASACSGATLNGLMALDAESWSALRLALSRSLTRGSSAESALHGSLIAQADAEHGVPAHIGDYTDFYTSIHHATRVGKLFRPDNPLLPNYKWVPIGYHGRSSTIGVSGQSFRRPNGQTLPPGADAPTVAPSKRLDYEAELGVFVGTGNRVGEPIAIAEADRHVFGLCLLNDWSARDIQGWEYQPLGPFLSKNFATTISPWVVTLEALAPYRVAWTRASDDPQPLPYLESSENRTSGALDIQVEVWLETQQMRAEERAPVRLSRTSFRHGYWTIAQMVAHHTFNGCGLRPGDLLGSGTVSGPALQEAGSLLELSNGGKTSVPLENGESRTFLQDNDAVILRGWCEKAGAARIGFGECRGTVLPAAVVASTSGNHR